MKLPRPKLRPSILAAFVAVPIAIATWSSLQGADHRDSPLAQTNARLDLNDIYVFRSPENPANVVLVATVSPILTPAVVPIFEFNGCYDLLISNDGDVDADIIIRTSFDAQTPQGYFVEGIPGMGRIIGSVSGYGDPINVVTEGPVRVFCGVRDDPFFFDLDGFNAFLANPIVPTQGLRGPGAAPVPPVNFFGTLDCGVIVIELPVTFLTGGSSANQGQIRVWGTTYQRS